MSKETGAVNLDGSNANSAATRKRFARRRTNASVLSEYARAPAKTQAKVVTHQRPFRHGTTCVLGVQKRFIFVGLKRSD